ncbi:MAG: sigma-70 family RNA polymerase sigma factor [Candidatus Brocadia sp.]|nr:sigma-70 family RNA polymerase sigma factor [Candidatus Brocadia sp.]
MQEINLMRILERELEAIPLLTKEDEVLVVQKAQDGDVSARDCLIKSNLRFVLKIVYQYWSPGLPLMEMVAEGCYGLVKSAKTFDRGKGFRFLTYAGKGVVQCVKKAIKDYEDSRHESLDEPVHREDDQTITRGDLLESKEQQSDQRTFCNQVSDCLDILDDRERMIITMRYWQFLTLDKMGQKLHLKKERIRQIELKALRKLRNRIEEIEKVKKAGKRF